MLPGTVLVVGAGLAGTPRSGDPASGGLRRPPDRRRRRGQRPVRAAGPLQGVSRRHEERAPAPAPPAGVLGRLRDRAACSRRRVVRIDPALRTATLSSGEVLTWDALVLATGARPRSLPFAAPAGVHTLRTLADARALRASLVPGARLAVVGGGFIGAEVASTAVALGLDVTLIEALRVPFERTLGADVGQLLAERYRSYGVELRLATGVVGFRAGADGGVRAARLTDGTEVPCDLALVGIGIEPARELLPHPLAGYPIYPCGDVTGGGGHWTSAAAQGSGRRPPDPRPPASSRPSPRSSGRTSSACGSNSSERPPRPAASPSTAHPIPTSRATTTAKDGSSEPSQPIDPPQSPRSDESSSSLQIAALSRPRAVRISAW